MTLLELLQQPLNRAAGGEFTLAESQAVNNFRPIRCDKEAEGLWS